MRVAIVGHAADKFNAHTQGVARSIIGTLLKSDDVLVSGRCPLGGVDIWAEEIANTICFGKPLIFEPKQHSWEGQYGYKKRNLDIANNCDIIHVIVVEHYPEDFNGMTFDTCYHCNKGGHVKSGGCWTAKRAKAHGIPAKWHIIPSYGLPLYYWG